MTRGDRLIEHGAARLEETAERFRSGNGWKAKLAGELADDAAFLRKLKPSLIAARARGLRPPEPRPAEPPAGEHDGPARVRRPRGHGGPNPLVVAAAAFALGIVLAKVVDWRGHAHPRG